MDEYKIGRFTFDSLDEYNAAKREISIIKKLKYSSDLTDPKVVNVILTSFIPQTVIGKTFVQNLRGNAAKEENPPPVSESILSNNVDSKEPVESKKKDEIKQQSNSTVRNTEKRQSDRLADAIEETSPIEESRGLRNNSERISKYNDSVEPDVHIDMAKVERYARLQPSFKNYNQKGLGIIAILVIILFVLGGKLDRMDPTVALVIYCIDVGILVTYCLFFIVKRNNTLKQTKKLVVEDMKKHPEKYNEQEENIPSNNSPTTRSSSDTAVKALGTVAKLATYYAVGNAAVNATKGITESIIPSVNPNTARYQQAHENAMASARRLDHTTQTVGKYEVTTLHNGKQVVKDGLRTVGTYDKFNNVTKDRAGRVVGRGNQLDKLMKK